MTVPYKQANPGEPIYAEDWNEIQVSARSDIDALRASVARDIATAQAKLTVLTEQLAALTTKFANLIVPSAPNVTQPLIDGAKVSDKTISGAKLADKSIDGSKIADGSLDGSKLASSLSVNSLIFNGPNGKVVIDINGIRLILSDGTVPWSQIWSGWVSPSPQSNWPERDPNGDS